MKIIGIGNALVDVITLLENEDILKKHNLPRGSMTLVDSVLSSQIYKDTLGLTRSQASGGAAANTIHGLANLGVKSSFVGKTGNDDTGNFFQEDMENAGIFPHLLRSDTATGRVMSLVSPDSERTMATYLGAAVELSESDLSENFFDLPDFLYIEGYLVANHAFFQKAVKMAKKAGLTVCVDLASYNIVEQNRDLLLNDIETCVDIVFANEEEAKALTGKQPEFALEEISQICEIAVVKTGPQGSLIKSGEEACHVPAPKVQSVDTTGAGDIYAAGFLYGMFNALNLEKCGMIGTFLATEVIQVMGPKLNKKTWAGLKTKIEQYI